MGNSTFQTGMSSLPWANVQSHIPNVMNDLMSRRMSSFACICLVCEFSPLYFTDGMCSYIQPTLKIRISATCVRKPMFLPLFCCTPLLEKTEFHTLVEDIPDLQYRVRTYCSFILY